MIGRFYATLCRQHGQLRSEAATQLLVALPPQNDHNFAFYRWRKVTLRNGGNYHSVWSNIMSSTARGPSLRGHDEIPGRERLRRHPESVLHAKRPLCVEKQKCVSITLLYRQEMSSDIAQNLLFSIPHVNTPVSLRVGVSRLPPRGTRGPILSTQLRIRRDASRSFPGRVPSYVQGRYREALS